ncbi:hypothetical protein EUX98_g8217 [Antrodiella citrinella]|uniref:CRIB domain-containing protein n=1 Tax=Antrodiella citrinella TaxID=2447956 RepID=A0A4S4MGX3_9APHY|nr:hypothetical protein EUX98_g8217 [Antrodiella citrinella]
MTSYVDLQRALTIGVRGCPFNHANIPRYVRQRFFIASFRAVHTNAPPSSVPFIFLCSGSRPLLSLFTHVMSPGIRSPKPRRAPAMQHSISGPVEGSFAHVSHIPSQNDERRSTPSTIDPTTPHTAITDNKVVNIVVAAATPPKHSRSPSISKPLEGSFRHIGHMAYELEKGLVMKGVDPSWHDAVQFQFLPREPKKTPTHIGARDLPIR